MNDPIRVIFVDDHPIVRKGMIQIIADDAELEVVAEAGSAGEALSVLEKTEVDVAVVDFDMPGTNGLTLASELFGRTPPLPVVILTMHDSEQIFNEAVNCGVSAYLLKEEAVETISEGIKTAAKGQFFFSPSLSKHIARRTQRSNKFRQENEGLENLTPTERIVLKKVAENKSSKQIAAEMGVSYRTITTHRNNISTKLALTGNHPLINFALDNKSAIFSLPSK